MPADARFAYSTRRSPALETLAVVAMLAASAAPAHALDVLPDEKASREACEKRACQLVLDKKAAGPPLSCNMTKTWDRDKIKKGGQKKRMTWGFGDARCQLTLNLERSLLMPALTDAKYTLYFPPQKVVCQIEDTDKKAKPLIVTAAPKIKFKGGHADKVWINVTDVQGEGGVKSLVWTAAKLADGLGIFHKDTVSSINTFLHQTCPTEFGPAAKAAVKADAAKAAVKADAAKELPKPAEKAVAAKPSPTAKPAAAKPAAGNPVAKTEAVRPAAPASTAPSGPLKADAN